MPAHAPRSVDAYLLAAESCRSLEDLYTFYADEMRREGYDTIVFARSGRALDANPCGCCPDSSAAADVHGRLWELDPYLAASQSANKPLVWIDEMMRRSQDEAARRKVAPNTEQQSGLSIPFMRPGGEWDVVSLSNRDRRGSNPNRIAIVNLKTYVTVQRFIALTMGERPSGPWAAFSHDAEPHGDCAALPEHPQHGARVGVISDPECRALALVDIAWRRYSAGLLDLNRRVPEIVGEDTLDVFMDRGLIAEEPDDLRFHYVFRPTRVGQSHLKLCPCVSQWRDQVWRNYVEVHERPVD